MATLTDNGEMIYRIINDGFAENAVYHATCMIDYLLKRIKDDSEDYLTFQHNLFQSCIKRLFVLSSDVILCNCFVSLMYMFCTDRTRIQTSLYQKSYWTE
jgi:hypothetical protein